MLSKTYADITPLKTRAFKLLEGTFIFLSTFALSFIGIGVANAPAPGVVTELRCDEGAGTTAADASGSAHNGTLINGPTWGSGKYGQGINLDGNNDYINIADHADYTLTPTISYSWSAWVKNNNFNQWGTVWSQTLSTSSFFYFYAHTSADAEAGPVTNGISVYWYSGSNKIVLHSNNNVLTTGTWSNVTITYDASQAQASRFTIYINGTDVTNRSDVVSSGTIATIDPTNIRIGSNQPYGEYLNGSVDEIRYYRRLLSVAEVQSDMNTGNTPDTQPPTVNITAPAAGNISGTINVTANAGDNIGVVGVQFLLDGANLGAEDITAPYSVSWNTTTATNGNHNITARARDAAGNPTTSAIVAVNVNNIIDTELPTVSVTPPASSPVSGTINVDAIANDNVGIVGVQFLLNGVNLGTEDLTSPYSVSWNTTGVANGACNITARARDAAGNTATSAAVSFTVFNNNLVAAYGFNENTGTIANDNSGNGNTGILTNGPAWSVSGKYGAAILFDGTNDLVNINDANSLDLTNGMTIEAWVNPGNLTGYKTVICKENGTNTLSYALSANNSATNVNNQRPNSRIRIGTTTTTVTGTTKLALNTWTHIASTYDGAVLRFYVNGTQVSTVNVTGNMVTTANMLRIGGSTTLSTQYFAGLIDEVRVYNRALSQAEIQTDINTPIAPDLTNPTVNITAPAAGNVSGNINVSANASDNISVAGVQFLLNGANLGVEDITAPYSISWNTLTIANGPYTLTARARDAAGNTTTSSEVVVTVNNDTEQPTVNLTAPPAGTIAGTPDVTADAADNVAVAGVQFLLNGANLGSEDLVAPYSFSWNSTTITDGSYTLTARARDAAGNTKTSAGVIVNVLNHPADTEFPTVSITAPSPGEISGTINVTADAGDNVGVVDVEFFLNGTSLGAADGSAPYSFSWNTTSVVNGTYTLTARARDAAGNTTTSTEVIVTVNNLPDTESPAVSIIEPAAGTISGIVNLVASANDNIGIAGVQFLLDGNNLGSEDIVFPYSFSWNTTGVSNGNHTIAARARDAAGNTATSADVTFTVNNDVQGPAVSIASPAAGPVSGTININADANDNISVVGVQFLLNGSVLGGEDVSTPYSISWNTATATNGIYNLMARARDAAGNITTSIPVVVTVSNITNLITALHFNEGTGTNATDVSGKNHNGTLTGGATWTAGKYGQAVNLNGSNNYVNIADHADYTLNPAQSYTWSAWVKNNNFNEWSTVWSQSLNTTNFFYFYAHSTTQTDGGGGPVTNGVSAYWVSGTNKLALHSNNNVLTLGQWNHIAITYNPSLAQASRFTIYVNGADVTNRTAVGSTGTITSIDPTGIRIGSNSAFGEYLNGTIDEVRFYNRLLTATEIQSDMNTAVEVDNTAPVVNITAPANGSNVSGTVTVAANATDNVGVAGVQFMLDDVNLDVEDNIAPYSITWNTQLGTNSSHVLSARARDAKGNVATSTGVNVVVVPDFLLTLLTPVKNVEITGNTGFTIDVTYLNGFTSSNVVLSVTGLPLNTTGEFLFNPMSHQGETSLIVNTINATPGTYSLTLTASAEGKVHSVQATLVITAAADFALTASPSIQNVTAGNATTYTINVNETNDYVNSVTLSVLGLPTGVTASFNPTSVIPASTSVLTLTTTSNTVNGTYNLTVQGTSGAVTRTTPITLTVTSQASVWSVATMGSTGVQNNTVRVGALKSDGLERVYVGTITTGRMLEYSWNGTSWTGNVDIGGTPTGEEIHNTCIGPGRGDGKDRLYAASTDFKIYEFWNDATGWHQMTVGDLGNQAMHAAVGVGRNDGVTRLYCVSLDQLFEFTWNGTSWAKLTLGNTPGAHGVVVGNGRNDGTNNVYVSSISSGNFEAHFNGTSWTIASMGDAGDARDPGLGIGRNDGVMRVYAALYNGGLREFTWNGTAWTFVNMPVVGLQNIHAYIVPGRNDGFNRVYTSNGNGKLFEYSWDGSSWQTYNMGGGTDYMYGLHYGRGRNDGLIRFYSADRGSVNRVYEFTWTVPIIP
jgi:hypothetical protein